MKPNALRYLCLLLCLVLVGGCGGCGDDADEADPATTTLSEADDPDADTPEIDPNDPAAAMQEAQRAMQEALGGEGSAGIKEAVDFRKLKDVQPDEVGSLDRTSHTGERNKVMGMDVSQAEARYEDGNRRLTINVVDLGTLTGFARMGYATWLQMEMDRETDTGYERTTKYKGYPAFEKFEGDEDAGRCEAHVFVEDRFIVQIEGTNVSMKTCEEGREEVDYDDLKDLRNVGRE